eukprot:c26492_g1_i1 orf=660-842(-)
MEYNPGLRNEKEGLFLGCLLSNCYFRFNMMLPDNFFNAGLESPWLKSQGAVHSNITSSKN